MEKNKVLIPDAVKAKIEKELSGLLSGSATIEKINTEDQMTAANTLLKQIKTTKEGIEESKENLYRPLKTDLDGIVAWFKNPLDKLAALEKNLKTAIGGFLEVKRQQQIEDQRKADEIARKEREKIENQAREQREREDAARLAAEEATRKAQEETDSVKRAELQKEAAKKQAQADNAAAKAQTMESVAQTVVAPTIKTAPVASGFSVRYIYKVEVYDKTAFIKQAVAEGKLHLLAPEQEILDKMASAEQMNFKFAGCRVNKVPAHGSRK